MRPKRESRPNPLPLGIAGTNFNTRTQISRPLRLSAISPKLGDEVEGRSGGLGVGIKKATRVTTPPPEERAQARGYDF